jgi:polysaccharide biosynthesis transport protein
MSQEGNEISVSVQDLVGFVLRGLVPAVILASLAGATMYFLTQREDPVFSADATLLVARSSTGTQFGLSPVTAPAIDLSAYRVAASSDQVLVLALREMGVAEPTENDVRRLRSRTTAVAAADARDSSLLRVEARGDTPALATARANAVASALVTWDRRRASEGFSRIVVTLEQQIDALSEQIRSLQALGETATQGQVEGLVRLRTDAQQQLGYARALIASAEGLLSVLQPAETTPRQIAPRPLMSAAVAAFLAVLATYALLLLRSVMNTRLQSVADVAAASGLPVLAEFPTVGRNDEQRLHEASSFLRTNVLFATSEFHPRVLLVTSAREHEGKTTVCRHMAESMVRYGYRTLLVDADLRSPSVAEELELTDVDVSSTDQWLRAPGGAHNVLSVAVGDGQLDVVPQFEAVSDAPEALGRGLRRALKAWEGYDVIVIDAAPVLAVSDTQIVAPHCTGTVLVVDQRRTDRRSLLAAKEVLQRVGVNILGIVSNRVKADGSSTLYGTAGGYGERQGSSRPQSPVLQATARTPRARD